MIVQDLQARPEKIRRCLAAVRSNQFLPKDFVEETFGDGALYMLKLPKSWVDQFLEDKHSRFDTDAKRLLVKADRTALHKIFYRACMVDKTSYIGNNKVSVFTAEMDKRFNECRQDLRTVRWGTDGEIDWRTSGLFVLEPPMPAGTVPEQHTYAKVTFRSSPPASIDLKTTVTGAWTIVESWSIRRATLTSPEGEQFVTQKKCADLFKDDESFMNFFGDHGCKRANTDTSRSSGSAADGAPAPSDTSAGVTSPEEGACRAQNNLGERLNF